MQTKKTVLIQRLRALALTYSEVEEGIACKGTPLECSTFKTHRKTFLFLSEREIKLKLHKSLATAAKNGVYDIKSADTKTAAWVTVKLNATHPPLDTLKHWIAESYGLTTARSKA